MTEKLRQALAELERLPDAAQNEAAARIQAIATELADRRWNELLSDPRSERFFDEMANRYERAKRENAFSPLPTFPATN